MARLPEVVAFARERDMPVLSVEDLRAYRVRDPGVRVPD